MTRLSLATLDRLPAEVARPAYDPTRVRIGIVHLGLGAFHRAHQAVYTDQVLASDPRWGILGVSMKTPRATVPLAEQDGLYTVVTKDAASTSTRVIGALRRDRVRDRRCRQRHRAHRASGSDSRHAHRHREGLLPRRAGGLDFAHPDIAHDVVHPRRAAVRHRPAGGGARGPARRPAAARSTSSAATTCPPMDACSSGWWRARARRRPAVVRWIADNVAFPVDDGRPHRPGHDAADIERNGERSACTTRLRSSPSRSGNG